MARARIKTIKHTNMLRPNPGLNAEGYNYLQFTCRGCTMRYREEAWRNYVSSIDSPINRNIDNSYLTLEEEPSNRYDPNAVKVVCRGEHFGDLGYVGKEFAPTVKEILGKCISYRVDMIDEAAAGNNQIELIMTWNA